MSLVLPNESRPRARLLSFRVALIANTEAPGLAVGEGLAHLVAIVSTWLLHLFLALIQPLKQPCPPSTPPRTTRRALVRVWRRGRARSKRCRPARQASLSAQLCALVSAALRRAESPASRLFSQLNSCDLRFQESYGVAQNAPIMNPVGLININLFWASHAAYQT